MSSNRVENSVPSLLNDAAAGATGWKSGAKENSSSVPGMVQRPPLTNSHGDTRSATDPTITQFVDFRLIYSLAQGRPQRGRISDAPAFERRPWICCANRSRTSRRQACSISRYPYGRENPGIVQRIMRLAEVEHCARKVPRWNMLSISPLPIKAAVPRWLIRPVRLASAHRTRCNEA